MNTNKTILINEAHLGDGYTADDARRVVAELAAQGWNVAYGDSTGWGLDAETKDHLEAAIDAILNA